MAQSGAGEEKSSHELCRLWREGARPRGSRLEASRELSSVFSSSAHPHQPQALRSYFNSNL